MRHAFHTEIHNFDVGGVHHIANMTDPKVPAALAGVVRGVVSLHDFKPHTNFKPKPAYTFTNGNGTFQAVVPSDLAKIYNFNPLFSGGVSGQGQTIVVIEDTNVYNTADWTTFRSRLGLSGYSGASFTQVHPTGSSSCSNPGTVAGAESEATLDAEWASAGAPSAKIELASCADTNVTFGGLIALQNLLNSSTPPAIVSISYGECEAENGATANAAYNATYEQAVSMGTSVFVSSGDEGAASCDANLTKATHGIAVSGFASTPYDVAVGGTDYGDAYAGTTSTYWSNTNNSAYGSALSYIPEIPWNNSCASKLIATASGYNATYGSSGFCNSSTGKQYYLTTGGGSGGPSGCATGSPSTSGVVSGSCKRLCEAFVAEPGGRAVRWRARHPRRFAVRGERRLGALLCVLRQRHERSGRVLLRCAEHLVGCGRNIVRGADCGRGAGADQPDPRRQAGQSQSDLLRVGEERVWVERKRQLLVHERQPDEQRVPVLRRDAGRHGCGLHGDA